jgi:hypothetical protein
MTSASPANSLKKGYCEMERTRRKTRISAWFGGTALFALSAAALLNFAAPCAQAASLVANGSFENNGGVGELFGSISHADNWTVGPTLDGAPFPFVFILDSHADSTGFPSAFSPPNIFVWGPGSGVNNGFTGSPDGGYFLGVDAAYADAPVSQTINGLIAILFT